MHTIDETETAPAGGDRARSERPVVDASVTADRRRGSLWRHADFLTFWGADAISQFGSQVTLLALPLAAVLNLHAAPAQMGLLAAAGSAPFLLVGLFAGVWVDRLRRRPLLIAADVGRALILAAVPIAWALGMLRIEILYAVAFLAGLLTVVFDVAYVSYVPALVGRDHLVEANSKLESTASLAQVGGPGLGGLLVGALTAPFAIAVDAVSFLFSAVLLGRVRTVEPKPSVDHAGRLIHRDIADGLRVVFGDVLLRALTGSAATVTFFGNVFLAVYVLYLAGDLGLGPSAIGLVFATGGAGALAGALVAGPATRRFGIGPTIVGARLLFGLGGLPIPLAVLVPDMALPLVIASEFFQWMMLVLTRVNQLSLRQAIVPNHLQGRATATFRFVTSGSLPLGSLLGGALGETIGIQATLLVGVGGMLLAFIWVLCSPLRTLREPPEPAASEPGTGDAGRAGDSPESVPVEGRAPATSLHGPDDGAGEVDETR